MNSRDTLGALLLLGGLAAALLLAPDRPGPGPLALCTAVAAFHAALLMPAVGPGHALHAFLPFVLALPALASASFGHPWAALGGSLLLVALSCAAGWACRRLGTTRTYLATMLFLFGAPFGFAYLVREFGREASAEAWAQLSPLAAAGAMPTAGCIALLLAWPVWALARRARA